MRLRVRHLLAVIMGSALAVGTLSLPATAAAAPAVTLGARPTTVPFGRPSTVYGHITPRQAGFAFVPEAVRAAASLPTRAVGYARRAVANVRA